MSIFKYKPNRYYARRIMPKRVTS